MTRRDSKIAILGPYGFGNLGDAAIQQSMIDAIRTHLPAAEIVGISLNPEDTLKRHGIQAYSIGRMANHGWELKGWPGESLRRYQEIVYRDFSGLTQKIARTFLGLPVEILGVFQALRNAKTLTALFASGGGQIDDDWGGAFHHPYSLWLWAELCHLLKVKYCFVSVGAGPLTAGQSIRFVRRALQLSDYCSFRDEYSRQFMAVRGYFRNDPVFPDLAHSLHVERFIEHPQRAFAGPVIGIGPMPYNDPRVWPKKDANVYQAYLNKLISIIDWLIQRGYSIVLFSGEAVHDRAVIEDILALGEKVGLKIGENVCAPSIETVDELMYTLAGVDLVIASRFHGVLLPMLLDKPVVATSYHPKVGELMKDTGQGDYCLPIDSFTVDELKDRFIALEAHQEESRAEIHARIEQYRQALDEQYDIIFRDL